MTLAKIAAARGRGRSAVAFRTDTNTRIVAMADHIGAQSQFPGDWLVARKSLTIEPARRTVIGSPTHARPFVQLRLARRLLVCSAMMKTLLSSALLSSLAGSAFAQPAPPPARKPYELELSITDGADNRAYDLVLVDESCGSVEERVGDRKDEVKVCARPSPEGVRLSVTWQLHTKALDHEVSYVAVVAKGKAVSVGRTKGARLVLTWL